MKNYLFFLLFMIQTSAMLNASETNSLPWDATPPEIQCQILHSANDQTLAKTALANKSIFVRVMAEITRTQMPTTIQWAFLCNRKNLTCISKKKLRQVAISDDNRFIITIKKKTNSDQCELTVYNAETLESLSTIRDSSFWTLHIAISHDTKRIITCGICGIKTWNIEDGVCLSKIRIPEMSHYMRTMAVSKDEDFVVTCSRDTGNIVKWNTKTGERLKLFPTDHKSTLLIMGARNYDTLNCFQISSNDAFVVTGGFDGTVKFWDLENENALHTLKVNDDSSSFKSNTVVSSLCISKDTKTLATATGKSIKLWDCKNFSHQKKLIGHQDLILSMTFNADNTLIITGSVDGKVKIWHVDSGSCMHTIDPKIGSITSVTISNDNTFIAISGKSGCVVLKFNSESTTVDSPSHKKNNCTIS